jgi:hypothetical protein
MYVAETDLSLSLWYSTTYLHRLLTVLQRYDTVSINTLYSLLYDAIMLAHLTGAIPHCG